MEAASALSNMGILEAETSSDTIQQIGFIDGGILPQVFGHQVLI